MFNNKLQPLYDGKVLANQTAMDNPVVQSVLKEMFLRNLNPKDLMLTGYGTSATGTNYEWSNE